MFRVVDSRDVGLKIGQTSRPSSGCPMSRSGSKCTEPVQFLF